MSQLAFEVRARRKVSAKKRRRALARNEPTRALVESGLGASILCQRVRSRLALLRIPSAPALLGVVKVQATMQKWLGMPSAFLVQSFSCASGLATRPDPPHWPRRSSIGYGIGHFKQFMSDTKNATHRRGVKSRLKLDSAVEPHTWSPSHDQCGMLRPIGTSSADWW